MKLLRIGILIILIAAAASCKKKEYPVSVMNNESVFYFKGQVNNNPISFGAGVDDYYMYSSYNQDSGGVYAFGGSLKKLGCNTNCGNSLNIVIRDAKAVAAGAVSTPSAFTAPAYPFVSNSTSYEVSFKAGYNKTPIGYRWDFGDGSPVSTQENPTHRYQKSGTYQVCLTINGANGYVSNICNTVKAGLPVNTCKASITGANASGNTVSFSQTSSGQGTLDYLWNFGDGTRSSSVNPVHTYTIPGSYPVSLRVTDAGNEVAYTSYNVITQSDLSSFAANFLVMSITPVVLQNLSTASFNWTDDAGKVYSTDGVTQPSSSYFKVISVEDYSTNEKGQKTKKIKLNIKCKLSDGTDFISIDDAETVICVAYN